MLRISNTPASRVWFSSDFHLGHNKEFVWKNRGYDSVESHSAGIINKVNDVVGENDTLFFLGDFCLNSDESMFNKYIDSIKCQNIHMIWGNHNNPVEKIYKREVSMKYGPGVKVYPFRYKNIVFEGDYIELFVNGQILILMHYPIDIWNFMKEGGMMLCGHSHYNYPNTVKDSENGKVLDVGWDGHGSPYSFEEIMFFMKNKNVKQVDHHVL